MIDKDAPFYSVLCMILGYVLLAAIIALAWFTIRTVFLEWDERPTLEVYDTDHFL